MSASTQRQILFFTLIGACAALIHLVMLVVLVRQWHIEPFWANPMAFLCAFGVSFYGHLSWTFRHDRAHGDWFSSLWRWLLSSVSGFVLNQILFAQGLRWLGPDRYIGVWFVVTALVTLFSFVLAKFWAFGRRQSSQKKLL